MEKIKKKSASGLITVRTGMFLTEEARFNLIYLNILCVGAEILCIQYENMNSLLKQ